VDKTKLDWPSVVAPLKQLIKTWGNFMRTVLDPLAICLVFFTWLLFRAQTDPKNSPNLIFTLLTISSALAGGRIAERWAKATEEGATKARGTLAVRSLKILLGNLTSLEGRVQAILAKDSTKIHPDVTKSNYEEILARCVMLEKETVSSIENWNDIVQGADITSMLSKIETRENDRSTVDQQLAAARNALSDATGKSSEEIAKLRAENEKLEKQSRSLNHQILGLRQSITGPFGEYSGGSVTLSTLMGVGKVTPSAGTSSTLVISDSDPIADANMNRTEAKRGPTGPS
jgi:hypothetical protein